MAPAHVHCSMARLRNHSVVYRHNDRRSQHEQIGSCSRSLLSPYEDNVCALFWFKTWNCLSIRTVFEPPFPLNSSDLSFYPRAHKNCQCPASLQITLHPGANLLTARGDLLTLLAQVPVLDECDKSMCVIIYVSTQSKMLFLAPPLTPFCATNLRVTSYAHSLLFGLLQLYNIPGCFPVSSITMVSALSKPIYYTYLGT